MGNADTKLVFRKAIVQLTSKSQVLNSNIYFAFFFFMTPTQNRFCFVFPIKLFTLVKLIRFSDIQLIAYVIKDLI